MKKSYLIFLVVFLVLVGVVAYNMSTQNKGGMGMAMNEAGKEAQDFTLSDLDGNSVALSSLRGKVVFLNFWATWCPPCRAEMPSMQKLHEKMKGKDFAIVAVDVGERHSGVKAFIEKKEYTFMVLLDSEHRVSTNYQVAGIPTTLILDKQGKIVLRETGSRDWAAADIITKIEDLLK